MKYVKHTEKSRFCYQCSQWKPTCGFNLSRTLKSGYDNFCRDCRRREQAEYSKRNAKKLVRATRERRKRQRLLNPKRCPTCGNPLPRWHRYCSVRCRPSFHMPNARRGSFMIGPMNPAEFAFQVIMERRGVPLRYTGNQALRFPVNGSHYSPDFEDTATGELYEVCGTRQAFHQSKKKIAAFRKEHPSLVLHIVKPDGSSVIERPWRTRSRLAGNGQQAA